MKGEVELDCYHRKMYVRVGKRVTKQFKFWDFKKCLKLKASGRLATHNENCLKITKKHI